MIIWQIITQQDKEMRFIIIKKMMILSMKS